MSEHSERYPRWARALPMCRAALSRGHLIMVGNHYLFGHRKFHPATVNKLIDAGEAVRIGDCVVKWSAACA